MALFGQRVGCVLEARFCAELRDLDRRISREMPAAQRAEHTAKTYRMVVAAADAARDALPGAIFFVLGSLRLAERAHAHLHSSYATGLYDLGYLSVAWAVQIRSIQGEHEEMGVLAAIQIQEFQKCETLKCEP